jgi:hypothetical protein
MRLVTCQRIEGGETLMSYVRDSRLQTNRNTLDGNSCDSAAAPMRLHGGGAH